MTQTLKQFVNSLNGRTFKRYPNGLIYVLKDGEKVRHINLKEYL